MRRIPPIARPAFALSLLLVGLLTGLPGCSTGSRLTLYTAPTDAEITVVRQRDQRRIPVRPDRNDPGTFRTSLLFERNGRASETYTVLARPLGTTAQSHRGRSLVIDADLYRSMQEGTAGDRFMLIELPPARSLPPINMRLKFSGVRVTFPLSGGSEPLTNEWEQIRAGIKQELELAREPDPELRRVLDAMNGIELPDTRFETGTEVRLQDRVTRFYTVELEVVLPSLEPVTRLVSRIAAVSGQHIDGAGPIRGVPEFTPIDAAVEFRTTFVDSMLSITVEGVAPIGARVHLFAHDTGDPVEVDRTPGSTHWTKPFQVAPRRRYIYGYSEESVNGAALQKAFRIDIYNQATEEIPFSQLERLQRTAQ